MTRYAFVISSTANRQRVQRAVAQAPFGTRVELKASQRSLPQNSRMWAMLSDIAMQKEHAGRKWTPDQWKAIFISALGKEMQFMPALDGDGFIAYGHSSSDLSKEEMSNMIELMLSWGAENGVEFHDNDSDPAPDTEASKAA